MNTTNIKAKVRHEMFVYGINIVYLFAIFAVFAWYRRLLLAAEDITFTEYLFPLIEAIVLAKVIMIGDLLRLGRGFESKPLIYPTIYKTVVFAIFVALFKAIEHGVKGMWHEIRFWGGIEEMFEKGIYEILANTLVIFVALIPFFAVKELSRVLQGQSLSSLFFRNRVDEPVDVTKTH